MLFYIWRRFFPAGAKMTVCPGAGKSSPSEKASFCTSAERTGKASLTVETALVLPLFLLGMVTMISFMDIYKLETEHLQSLCEKAKETGMYAYVLNGKGPDEITLPDVYFYTPVGGLFSLHKVLRINTVKVHAWTGTESTGSPEENQQQEEMVYVTQSGSVYHKSAGCRYLSVSLNTLSGTQVSSARNSDGEKYLPCERCSRNQEPAGIVYVTAHGSRYHNRETCSGLKRTIRLVKLSELSGMRSCSSCGKG